MGASFLAPKSGDCCQIGPKSAPGYASLSAQKILEVTNKHTKYLKFNVKFMKKATLPPPPVRVSDVKVPVDLLDLSRERVEYKAKVSRYVLSVMDVFIRFHWLNPLQRKFPHHVAEHFFFLSGFSFMNIHYYRTAGEWGGSIFFNSSLPLPHASQTLRH